MSKWRSLHIKNEILFWFFTLALLPLLILTTVNYIYEKGKYQEQYQKQLNIILKNKVKSINSEVDHISKEIRILSKIPIVKSALIDYTNGFKEKKKFDRTLVKYEDFFENIVHENNFYDLFLIDIDGNIVYSVAKEADLGTNLNTGLYSQTNLAKVFKDGLESLDLAVSNYKYYSPSNEAAAFVSIPMYHESRVIGSIVVQIDKKRILRKFDDKEGLGNSGEFIAAKIDEFGRVVPTTVLKNNPDAVTQKFQFTNSNAPIVKAANGERGSGITKDYLGNEIVAAWAYIPSLRWGIVAKIDLDEVLIPIADLRFYSIIILFFVGLGIVAAIVAAIKHIVEPISVLTKGVKSFAQGNMKKDVEIDVDNEIGELSKNFNEMAKSLTQSQNTVQKYADELEEKVEVRTKELENAKDTMADTYNEMQEFIGLVDKYIITSTTDINGKITKVSQALCDITGYSREELIGYKHSLLRHPDTSSEIYDELWETITNGKTWSGELKNQRKDGSFYWVNSTISPVFDENKKIKEYTSIRHDISDKKRVEELSITDQLTKLYNRFKIEDVFKVEIDRSKRYKTSFSVIMLDIDHFKLVNDNFGHDVGDAVLKDMAMILKSIVRVTDIVGRWGGEEFMVIASNTNKESALVLAEKIRKAIETHLFEVIGSKTASFGVSEYREGDTQEDIVKRADNGLYEAKENGRNRVVFLDD